MNYQDLIKKFVCTTVLPRITKCKKEIEVVEFEIYDFNNTKPKESMQGLVKLYKECELDKDLVWHFFIEGEFVVLRCSKKNAQKVFNYLKDNSMSYLGPRVWKEPWPITNRYQYTIFKQLFHDISESVMILYHDERIGYSHDHFVYAIAERMVHAWFNHNTYLNIMVGQGVYKYGDPQHWEAGITSNIALGRASFGGKLAYILEKESEEKAKKDLEKSVST